MIVVDIETSGCDFEKCGIFQIGAVDSDNPTNTFLEDARIDQEDCVVNNTNLVDPRTVQEVTGKSEKDMRDGVNQSQKELLQNFFKWCEGVKVKNFIAHNTQFDYGFIIL